MKCNGINDDDSYLDGRYLLFNHLIVCQPSHPHHISSHLHVNFLLEVTLGYVSIMSGKSAMKASSSKCE